MLLSGFLGGNLAGFAVSSFSNRKSSKGHRFSGEIGKFLAPFKPLQCCRRSLGSRCYFRTIVVSGSKVAVESLQFVWAFLKESFA